MRTSITARARSATTFDRVPPSMTPTLTRQSASRIVERVDREDLTRELVNRAGAGARIGAGVRGHAVRDELELSDALACGLHRAAGQRRFEHEHRARFRARDARSPPATSRCRPPRRWSRAAHASVAVHRRSRHSDPGRRHADREARLHVEHAGPVQPAVPFLDGHAGDLADRPDGVEVSHQQTRAGPCARPLGEHMVRRRPPDNRRTYGAGHPAAAGPALTAQASSAARSVLGDSATTSSFVRARRRWLSRSPADKKFMQSYNSGVIVRRGGTLAAAIGMSVAMTLSGAAQTQQSPPVPRPFPGTTSAPPPPAKPSTPPPGPTSGAPTPAARRTAGRRCRGAPRASRVPRR